MFNSLMFKDNSKLTEDISSDLLNLTQSFKSLPLSSKDLQSLPKSKPDLWLSPILLLIFSSASLNSMTSMSNLHSGAKLIKVLLNSSINLTFIQEILYSTNGIVKNILRLLIEIQTSSIQMALTPVFKSCLKLLEKISKLKLPENFYIPEIFQVVLELSLKGELIDGKFLIIAYRILKNLASEHYLFFLEANGPDICIISLTQALEWHSSTEIAKVLLELLLGTLSHSETVKAVQNSSFIESLKHVVIELKFELFSHVLSCLNGLVLENSSFTTDIIQSRLVVYLFESMEYLVPQSLLLIEPLVKFITLICSHIEGIHVISRFSILTRITESIITSPEDLCDDYCISIGENLKKIVNYLPNAVEKCVEGCISTISSIKNPECSNCSSSILLNTRKLLKYCFVFSSEILTEFFTQVSFDDLLILIQYPDHSTSNSLSWLTSSLKKIPEDQLSSLMIKTIHSLCQIFDTFEAKLGPLYQASLPKDNKDSSIIDLLSTIETHVETLRVIVDTSKVSSNHYHELSNCLINLGFLAKICIDQLGSESFNEFSNEFIAKEFEFKEKFENIIEKIGNFFSSCAHGCCMKPQRNLFENSAFCILKNLGEILASLLAYAQASKNDSKTNFISSSIFKFVTNVMFNSKTFTVSLLYSFYSALGMQSVYRLLGDIKNLFRNCEISDCGLLELWASNLNLLLALVKSCNTERQKKHFLLMSLGCSDSEAFIKELKIEALFYFKHNNFDQSSKFKIKFKKVELSTMMYFLEHLEEFFEEGQETEHFYLHTENKVKGCRNLIRYRGFDIGMEGIIEEIIEFSLKNRELFESSAELLLKIGNSCELLHKNVLEALHKELQLCLFSDLTQNDIIDEVFCMLHAVYVQQSIFSQFSICFEENLATVIKIIFERLENKAENLHLIELVFKVIIQMFRKNFHVFERFGDSLIEFCRKINFEIFHSFFEVFVEFLIKACENIDIIEKIT